jgi:cytidylate kinase
MRARQRELATDAVLEGRDTGSVVCPQADLKVFLVATSRVRAERRARQVQLPVEQVEQAIVERDSLDSEQSAPAPDAVLIDTGGMDASQVADRIVQLARERV